MALALAGTESANAQVIGYGRGYYGAHYFAPGLPPSQIMQIVRHAGFAPLSAPVRRGPNYVIAAVGRGGTVRVVVNAYGGDIVSVRPVLALQPYGAPYGAHIATVPPVANEPPPPEAPGSAPDGPGAGGAAYDPRAGSLGPNAGTSRGPQPPLPPRAIPEQRFAHAPTTGSITAPAQPARTPIPRPRPSVAANEAPATVAAPAPTVAPPGAAASSAAVPEAAPAPTRARPATPMVPVAPLD
jgi:hypothetical protein